MKTLEQLVAVQLRAQDGVKPRLRPADQAYRDQHAAGAADTLRAYGIDVDDPETARIVLAVVEIVCRFGIREASKKPRPTLGDVQRGYHLGLQSVGNAVVRPPPPRRPGGRLMPGSWAHEIAPLAGDELAAVQSARDRWLARGRAYSAGWGACSAPRCSEQPHWMARFLIVTGRSGRVGRRQRRYCQTHAERFAAKYGLELEGADAR